MKFETDQIGGRELDPVRIDLSGDEKVAQTYIPIGRKVLGNLKQRMQFNNLTSHNTEVTYDDGTVIFASSIAGTELGHDIDYLKIFSPEESDRKKPKGKDKCLGFIVHNIVTGGPSTSGITYVKDVGSRELEFMAARTVGGRMDARLYPSGDPAPVKNGAIQWTFEFQNPEDQRNPTQYDPNGYPDTQYITHVFTGQYSKSKVKLQGETSPFPPYTFSYWASENPWCTDQAGAEGWATARYQRFLTENEATYEDDIAELMVPDTSSDESFYASPTVIQRNENLNIAVWGAKPTITTGGSFVIHSNRSDNDSFIAVLPWETTYTFSEEYFTNSISDQNTNVLVTPFADTYFFASTTDTPPIPAEPGCGWFMSGSSIPFPYEPTVQIIYRTTEELTYINFTDTATVEHKTYIIQPNSKVEITLYCEKSTLKRTFNFPNEYSSEINLEVGKEFDVNHIEEIFTIRPITTHIRDM